MNGDYRTLRQMMAAELEGGMRTAKDLSRALGIREKEVIEHLPHVARSLGHKGPHEGGREEKLVTEPSECLGCGFVFRKRARLKTPGKCPVCRSEEITETRYGIKGG